MVKIKPNVIGLRIVSPSGYAFSPIYNKEDFDEDSFDDKYSTLRHKNKKPKFRLVYENK